MPTKKYKAAPLTPDTLFAPVPGLSLVRALLASSRHGMFCIKNARRQYVAANAAFVARSRVANEAAVLGRTAAELFPPLLAAGYERQDDVVLATGRTFTDKLELVTNGDGSTGWYLTQKLPLLLDGHVVGIVSVSEDLGAPAADDPRLNDLAGAVERIQRDYAQPLRVELLAQSAGLSIGQFERRMRHVLRVSPRQLLTQTRLAAAARALRETSLPLRDVAAGCGFYDQAHFSRQFRAATGIPPGRYRRSIREQS